ncbi:exported protein of unknown function [Candidatus Nitrosocosmicus arcticus]|uniref:Uncharacterized protein n=2 Tax=Candidatus Nitrosocosmicus arcticus TaxID=2035267 RepID=A0A557SRU0_9ARCH|nr:exported protein of unknown function [Candidatus Nitrosocosmicus arcticus]
MKLESYMLMIVLLSALMVPMSIGTYLAYGSSDDDDDDANDSENQVCYHSGFEAGQSGSYNQTQQSDCGNSETHYAHAYYQGFIQGCISSGEGNYFACENKTPGPP